MDEKSCTTAKSCAGFTIIELLMVVIVVGVMMGVAFPYLRRSSDRGGVTEAVVAMSTLHARAKLASVQRGRVTRLRLNASGSTMWIVATKASGSGLDTIGPIENVNTRFGVTFTTTRDSLVFTPRGIGTETSGTTIIVSKGTAADTITVTAAGRLIH
jgi:prepilin-type N-terminal cleavage/methylation domain-containing protein